MPDQHGFGDNGTESARPRQSGQGDDQMNEYNSEVAHSGNGINTSKNTAPRPIWQFAIDMWERTVSKASLTTSQAAEDEVRNSACDGANEQRSRHGGSGSHVTERYQNAISAGIEF